jgi:galactofuranose transport system ATP-binding protein
MTEAPLLQIRGLVKSFPGMRALNGVDLDVQAGEIHALLGENGAGKSTLINIITGALRRDGGEVVFAGQPIDPHSPAAAEHAGIAAVHQEVPLLPNLTVAENLAFGREPTRYGFVDTRAMNASAKRAMAVLGVDIDVLRPLGAYSLAVQQLIAIARVLERNARLVVLDEPTASLDAAEVATLFQVMKDLASRGVGIIFITHFIDQVYAVSDTITVLRNGERVTTRAAAAFPRRELVVAMIGKDLAEIEPVGHAAATETTPLVRAIGLKHNALSPIDLAFHAGEVTGAAGLLGSGRTQTALMLFGAEPAVAGVLEINGEAVRIASPRDAIRRRFALVAEDRKRDGVFPSLSIRDNIVIALQARRGWMRPLSRTQKAAIAERFIRLLAIGTPDADKPIGQLSGGNQQKALLARWLASDPFLMILDEPTRGVDVGAHGEILKLIARLREDGMAVYIISSEIDELLTVAHRVSVMRDHKQVRVLEGQDLTSANILAAIAGAS